MSEKVNVDIDGKKGYATIEYGFLASKHKVLAEIRIVETEDKIEVFHKNKKGEWVK